MQRTLFFANRRAGPARAGGQAREVGVARRRRQAAEAQGQFLQTDAAAEQKKPALERSVDRDGLLLRWRIGARTMLACLLA